MSLNHGPTIHELLADSLIQTVMRADQVEPQALRVLLHVAASRISEPRPSTAPLACRERGRFSACCARWGIWPTGRARISRR